jgi:hypothetical protein
MEETTGVDYQSSKFAKALLVERAKVGKTMFILGSALGILPWQKRGAIVSSPKHMHVLTFDSGALAGFKRFALEMCKAPEETLNFRVYNMQDDIKKIAGSVLEYDRSFFNTVMQVLTTVRERAAREPGVHALHVSSLTGMVEGILRAVQGPAARKKGGGMDQSKWGDFAGQIAELRNFAQLDSWHTLWEAHLYVPPQTGQEGQDATNKETLQMPGKSGQNFPYNVEQVFRVRREYSNTHEGTNVDLCHLDTKGGADFISGGRNFDALKDKEYDLTRAFEKLGLKVGNWGAKEEIVKKKKKTA